MISRVWTGCQSASRARAFRVTYQTAGMTASRPLSTSPPPKRLRQEPLVQTSMPAEGNTQNGATGQRNVHGRILNPKEQARRVKSKLKDRQKSLSKMGEEPIFFDVSELLGAATVQQILARGAQSEFEDKFMRGSQVECRIESLSAHGDGLAIAPSGDWVIAVPHCLPGELVLAQICSNERLYSRAVLVNVVEHAAESSQTVRRQDELVGCKYFGTCSGCQYQHIAYNSQLEIKRHVVSRAFRNYAHLDASIVPAVEPTLASPLQYGYRTKLTPHFELPKEMRKRRGGKGVVRTERPAELPDVAIGFDRVGSKAVLDIEECPIATSTINRALPAERKRVKDSIYTYSNGATILLRDSLNDFDSSAEDRKADGDATTPDTAAITDHKAVIKERVNTTKFLSPAGTFFQNNRSILPPLLAYVEERIRSHAPSSNERYLVDAYCGSGLFSLCLAHLFRRVSGVEISADSIKYAQQNATLNGIDNVDFLAGDAQDIFKVSILTY